MYFLFTGCYHKWCDNYFLVIINNIRSNIYNTMHRRGYYGRRHGHFHRRPYYYGGWGRYGYGNPYWGTWGYSPWGVYPYYNPVLWR